MDILKTTPIRPPRLEPGDTIGIVAPASPFDADLFDEGIKTLESMGPMHGYRIARRIEQVSENLLTLSQIQITSISQISIGPPHR